MNVLGTVDRFYVGLDLGQAQNYTAISVLHREKRTFVERDPVTAAFLTDTRLTLRYIQRVPLGSEYPDIVLHLTQLLGSPMLQAPLTLALDATGVGAPVVDFLRKARLQCTLMPLILTGGHTVTNPGRTYTGVPRQDLLSNLQVLIEKGQLRIAQDLPGFDDLCTELNGLRTRGTIEEQDDLAFSLALAAWPARRCA